MGRRRKGLCLSLLCLLLAACLLTGCGESKESSWQEQYDLGTEYLEEGKWEKAIEAFTAAIGLDPDKPEAYVDRARAYVGSGETEDNLAAAQSDYEAALDLDDSLAEAWLGLADLYAAGNDPEKARELLEEARDKTGEDRDVVDRLEELLKELEPEEAVTEPENPPEGGQPDGSQPEQKPQDPAEGPSGGTEGQPVDAKTRFDQFLAEKGYESALDDWVYGQPQEYALLDVNEDGCEELIISGRGDMPEFAGLAVFRLDPQSGQIIPVQIYTANMQGETVGQFFNVLEYSRKYQALVYSEVRTAYAYGSYDYCVLVGDRLKPEFSIGYEVIINGDQEETSYSLRRGGNTESLTEEQYQAYLDGLEIVQFQPLPS